MLISTTNYSNTKEFKNSPPGSHLGRLYKIVDLGTQQGEWEGKATYARKMIFYFELHGEDDKGQPLVNDDGKPLIVTKYYNASLGEKATLRKHLQTWLNLDFSKMPEGFKVENILGKFAMINVTTYQKDGKTRASVEGLSAVPAIVVKHGLPEGVNEISIFDLNKFDSAKFDALSDGIKKMIMSSPEYRALTQQPESSSDDLGDDQIPF
jgi:uncharacterized protein YfkK (UPF0435 family)